MIVVHVGCHSQHCHHSLVPFIVTPHCHPSRHHCHTLLSSFTVTLHCQTSVTASLLPCHSQQDDTEDTASGPLPAVVDIHCTLLAACSHIMRRLFDGPPTCQEENQLDHFLQSPLLQR